MSPPSFITYFILLRFILLEAGMMLSKCSCNNIDYYNNLTSSAARHSTSYSKYSKILNTSCLPKWPRQTVQPQIRLLQKKQSDQCLPSL